MRRSAIGRARPVIAIGAALLLAASLAGPAAAADYTAPFPAGVACEDFDLILEGTVAKHGPSAREFTDQDGGVVMVLTAGTGDTLTFINGTTEERLSLRSNGSGSVSRPGPGALTTVTTFGHTVIILWPTDVPAGPSTTLYTGRVVYTVDAFSNFVLVSSAGSTMDICAALR
jgi:hypothetical protein